MYVLSDKRLADALQRVAAREDMAPAVKEFCAALIDTLGYAATEVEAPPAEASTANADDFPMPFGKYKDTPISKVPPDYWAWLLKQNEPIKHAAVARWVRTHIKSSTP